MTATGASDRIDWQRERDQVDLVVVAEGLLRSASGERGSKLVWLCPFHDDHSPSLVVDRVKQRWKCYP